MFTIDFTKVEANIPLFEGLHRVKVTKATPFIRTADKRDSGGQIIEGEKVTQLGMKYSLEMVGRIDDKGELQTKTEDGENLMGRTVSQYQTWLHSDGGWKFSKPFYMAAAGYRKNQENEANTELFQKNEWYLNGDPDSEPENIKVSNGLMLPVGKVVDVVLKIDRQPAKDGSDKVYENQDFKAWYPVVENATPVAAPRKGRATAGV